jgi:hypothetical protein
MSRGGQIRICRLARRRRSRWWTSGNRRIRTLRVPNDEDRGLCSCLRRENKDETDRWCKGSDDWMPRHIRRSCRARKASAAERVSRGNASAAERIVASPNHPTLIHLQFSRWRLLVARSSGSQRNLPYFRRRRFWRYAASLLASATCWSAYSTGTPVKKHVVGGGRWSFCSSSSNDRAMLDWLDDYLRPPFPGSMGDATNRVTPTQGVTRSSR